MTQAELREKIKSGNIGGAYIFAGEEDYLKKHYLGELAGIASVDKSFEVFTRAVFDGEEIDFGELKDAISSPPMFSEYKLIEWRYADIDRMSESEKKRLEELCEFIRDYPYAVFVLLVSQDGLDAGTVKRPSRLAARLSKCFNLVNFEKSTDAQLIGWLKKHFAAEGIEVDTGALSALIFRSGHGMQILRGEVEKLSAYAKANSLPRITEREIELVASPTLECDAFALSGAITDKNRERAYTALLDMKMRRIEAGGALATLSRAFGELVTVAMLIEEGKGAQDIEQLLKWNAYKIKICIGAARAWGVARLTAATLRLKELDAASKSGGTQGYAPIEAFVAEYL